MSSAPKTSYPIVMRMQGMHPRNLAGYEKHRMRRGGDHGHCERTLMAHNRRLIGSKTWAQDAWDEIQDMRHANHLLELEQLRRRRRKTELKNALFRGPRDPWRATRHGPLREIILTVNKEWFDKDLTEFFGESGPTREMQFETRAKQWLLTNFGDDCVHARADLDETAYHIHAVIIPRAVTTDGRRMLQPAVHPMIRSYEKAQDSVGEWFAAIGLRRGERRKQALREALKHNRKVREARANGVADPGTEIALPEHRDHVSPRKWRESQEIELASRDKVVKQTEDTLAAEKSALAKQKQTVTQRQQDAQSVLDVAAAVAEGRVDIVSDLNETVSQVAQADTPSPVRALFGRALEVLHQRARKEARAELTDEFTQIEAADAALLEIAKTLPDKARQRLAQARRSLSLPLNALRRRLSPARFDDVDRGSDEKT
ncbi:plasmid recombination protein [Thioclava electrotropha]|uniref:Pre (Mob) type recombination enzyme n=1 Tax=Thioclava electrotropha TaxID=1549850 RepID=A0ABX6YYT0_9RHOB|nr:plasmid recombination protein [Thioclava electrotropha]QPZ92325.1 Pre (Mob) type recombination enzyme [Thioclava electrotropha]